MNGEGVATRAWDMYTVYIQAVSTFSDIRPVPLAARGGEIRCEGFDSPERGYRWLGRKCHWRSPPPLFLRAVGQSVVISLREWARFKRDRVFVYEIREASEERLLCRCRGLLGRLKARFSRGRTATATAGTIVH